MQNLKCLRPAWGLSLALHVQRNAALDLFLASDAIDRLLHLAVTPVATLDGVGGGRQQLLIQESQRLLQGRGEDLMQGLAEGLEWPNAAAQAGESIQGRFGSATAVEQAIDLVHDPTHGAQAGLAAHQTRQRAFFRGAQAALHEEMTMVEEVRDLLLEALLAPNDASECLCERSMERYRRRGDIGDAWKSIAFTQFHDVLPGSAVVDGQGLD